MSWLKLALLVGLLASAWLVGQAHARLGESALALGRSLVSVSPAAGHETAIELNGQAFRLASLSSDDAPAAVLARVTRELPRGLSLRYEASEGTGAVLALDALRGPLSSSAQPVPAADAAAFGLRYVFVRQAADGGSHVLVAWTEGRLELAALFPASGDAAGSDIAGLPRPQAAVRVLSARVPDGSYAFAAYRVAGEPDAALERYAAGLAQKGLRLVRLAPQRGWIDVAERGRAPSGERALVHSFRQGDRSVIALVRAGGPVPSLEGHRGE
jgi:hypothetical protein